MNELERYPHLMSAALGLPPWAMHLRTLNNLNTWAAICIAIFIALSQTFGSGLVYAFIYFVGRLITAGVGSLLAQRHSMLASIVLCTIVSITLNCFLALHFFGIWSPIADARP